MRRVEVLCIGKLRDVHLRLLCDDYYRRCIDLLRVSERELRGQRELEAAVSSASTLIVLDERGKQFSSREFAGQLERWIAASSHPLIFAIGGPDGFDETLRGRANQLLSLGRMTFAHRHVRLLLAEQLYRAVSIVTGGPYHRS